ncbi:carboxypeptidase-like regulatory domain-containing protein, partial [bacterium]|nr:carboxypeptidase-like regulatory domain-containing protein [bacterium]
MLNIRFPLCINQRWSSSESRLHHLLVVRYSLFATFALFLWLSTLSAQTVGKLAGTVLQAETDEPLPGANIVIIGTGMGAAADENGFYYILNVPPGKYELRAIMIGFETMKIIGVVVNGGRTTQIEFKLVDEILETDEVVVTAERPDVERDKTSTSTIVRFEDVQALPGVRDISDVLNLTSDVVDGHFRGGREGEQYYTLQGMGIVNPLDRSSAFLPIMSGVEEVEVITSGFGA